MEDLICSVVMIDPHTLRRLRRLLASGRQVDARLAADLLAASQDEEALGVLRCALERGDREVRSAVVQALAYHRSDAVLELLRWAAKQEQAPTVRAELVWALQATGQIELVAGMLRRDADAEVRLQAAVALGRTLPSNEQALIEALKNDPDVRVRTAAAESLGWVGTKASIKPLLEALHATEPEVRAEAAYALGRMADPDATQALLKLAERDPDEEVRRASLWGLVEIACATDDAALMERARAVDPVTVSHFENRRIRRVQVAHKA